MFLNSASNILKIQKNVIYFIKIIIRYQYVMDKIFIK